MKDHLYCRVDERHDPVEQLELKTLLFLDDVDRDPSSGMTSFRQGAKVFGFHCSRPQVPELLYTQQVQDVKSVKRNSFRTSLRTRRLLEQVECASVRHRPTGRNLGNALVIQ
jgi:hypothetical protein